MATGNVHYHLQERHRLQDVLVSIHNRTNLDNAHQFRRPNAQFYLRSAEEMAQLFAAYPSSLTTTLGIAERCQEFNLARDLAYVFPDYPTPNGEPPKRCSPASVTKHSTSVTPATRPTPASGSRRSCGSSPTTSWTASFCSIATC